MSDTSQTRSSDNDSIRTCGYHLPAVVVPPTAILLQGEVATIAGSSIIRIRLYTIYQERAWHNYTFADPQLF